MHYSTTSPKTVGASLRNVVQGHLTVDRKYEVPKNVSLGPKILNSSIRNLPAVVLYVCVCEPVSESQ